MSEHARLSELTGIAEGDEESSAFWPMNVVLVLLGTAILATAFYFLNPEDERWTHNPWTYALATPLALLVLSALFSTVVSRVVEKSMQMAFLLSVLVHLMLLIYAMNIIIFSRMWPDIIESIAQERHQLQRQVLQANQYHRVSMTTQTGRRPDYMRYVPTEHQPTKIETSVEPALQLARSQKANLVSPTPKVDRQANPHLLQRQKSSPSLPNANEHAASLSRSELQRTLDARSAPKQVREPESERREAVLQPSESTPARRTRSTADLPQPSAEPVASAASSERSLRRSESNPNTTESNSPPQNSIRRSRVANSRRGAPMIDVPRVDMLEQTRQTTASTQSELKNRSRNDRRSMATPTPHHSDPIASRRSNVQPSRRRDSQWRVPKPSAGDRSATISRDVAGGRSGPPAPNSMPVVGAESLAGQENNPTTRISANTSVARRSSSGRAPSSLPTLGAPSAQNWSGSPSLSGGVSGRSPVRSSANAAQGNAASNDVAGLTGRAKDIQRSALGMLGSRGPLSAPTDADLGDERNMSGNPEATNDSQDPGALSAGAAGLKRTASSNVPGTLQDPLAAAHSRVGNSIPGLPDGLSRAANPEASIASNSPAGQKRAVTRNSEVGAAPDIGEIAVPSVQAGNSQSAMVPEAFSGQRSNVRRANTGSTPLEIDALAGPGGIAPTIDTGGALLPRRSAVGRIPTPIDLDAQRFARRDVGGPLASGQKIAIPRPAFEKRMERLQDRDPLDETSAEPQTELAIERGLAFLAKHQRDDGSWRLQDFDTDVLMRSDTAATGLALLAFQGAGYTHMEFKYAEVVDKAITFLRERQQKNGDLYIPQDPASDQNAWLYSHGIAAIALCEAYGMTQDAELKNAAQKAIDFVVVSQDPQRGGWRYRPSSGSDTSVTGWFMMALKSGQLAGLQVPDVTFERLGKFVEESQVSDQEAHLYRYNPYAADTAQQRHGLRPTAVMTSVGLLIRVYTGWSRDREEMTEGADYLLEHIPQHGTRQNSRRDTYYWYYATQVLFHVGGQRWDKWHDELYPLLIDHQIVQGENEGSWDPVSPTPDLWARYGGRLYVTTMNLLSLEVSYRHLPLYEATAH